MNIKDLPTEIDILKSQLAKAQIVVLNEVKMCSHIDNFFPDGMWHKYVLVSDIDRIIERIKNDLLRKRDKNEGSLSL